MKNIPLANNKGFAVVDDDDFEYLSKYKWQLVNKKYAKTEINGKYTSMHRLILKADDNLEVDHVDRNGLNNQKNNLRQVTRKQNQENRGKDRDNTSGYKGVSFFKPTGRWRGFLNHNGKFISCGHFDTPLEAHKSVEYKRYQLGLLTNTIEIKEPESPPPIIRKHHKNNTSGYKNVRYDKKNDVWSIRIRVNGKEKFFGNFDNKEDANKRAIQLRKELGLK